MAISTKKIAGEEAVHYVPPRKTRSKTSAKMQPPLTPMIDVTFQLLLFFILTFTFRESEGLIPGTLPGNFQGEPAPDAQSIHIKIHTAAGDPTGVVYEIFDAEEALRAVAGGGRYDSLLEVLGGPKLGATGFGMGDVVLQILLEDKGRIPDAVRAQSLDFFVIDADEAVFPKVMETVAALRGSRWAADFSYKRQGVGKQLKEANQMPFSKLFDKQTKEDENE